MKKLPVSVSVSVSIIKMRVKFVIDHLNNGVGGRFLYTGYLLQSCGGWKERIVRKSIPKCAQRLELASSMSPALLAQLL